jgi:tetratricopeptide (TPR) repeat protein
VVDIERILSLEALRAEAIALYRAGQLAEAEGINAAVLRRNPDDFEALHLQGVIAYQTGRHGRAVELLRRAIGVHGRSAAAHLSLGAALMALGRYPEALASYESALALEPQQATALCWSAAALRALGRFEEALARARAALARQSTAEAYFQEGAVLRDIGRFSEAVASFDRAIALEPKYVDAYASRGIALRQLQRNDEALASFDRALALRPASAELHNNRGNVLRHLQRLPEALASYERAIALQPRFAMAHNNCGLALQAQRRYEEATASYQRALALQPDYADAHNNLGVLQYELGQPAAALASWRRALELQPRISGVHGNLSNALRDLERPAEALLESELGISEEPAAAVNYCDRANALFDLGRIAEAIASYDRAVALDPRYALAHFNKGLCLLLTGEFAQGLELYEWRKRLRSDAVPTSSARPWLGEEGVAGKTLFVHADQGLGDTIQFCRYAQVAAQRGAEVVLAVQPQLRELLTGLGPKIRVVARGEQPDTSDFRCALMSLPLAFRTTLADIPAGVPYLAAEPLRALRWRQQLGEHGLKVGIAWQGSRNRIDIGRSVPLGMFARLAAIPGVRLISLQKGVSQDELRAASEPLRVEALAGFDAGEQAFLDSAAVMSHLDLIITCDTALAHCAGALGRPTWIALKHVPDWRWLQDRADCPWYPSVRLFRQPRRSDWESVFRAIEAELTSLARARP